jgi:hypothetical protein
MIAVGPEKNLSVRDGLLSLFAGHYFPQNESFVAYEQHYTYIPLPIAE